MPTQGCRADDDDDDESTSSMIVLNGRWVELSSLIGYAVSLCHNRCL